MLYIVATPIGNLDDISPRAISALNSSDSILAEDTRVTRVLLSKYGINKPLVSYHQHSKVKKINEIINWLKEGKTLSLVSDAGTPGINDPGSYLVSKLVSFQVLSLEELKKVFPNFSTNELTNLQTLKIVPIPGPNAAITALSISGFPADRFVFLGFPPHKKGRQMFFKKIGEIEETVVFYESKHRIVKALNELKELSSVESRPLVVARELTKQFETIYRGTTSKILEQLNKTKALGEFVVVIRAK